MKQLYEFVAKDPRAFCFLCGELTSVARLALIESRNLEDAMLGYMNRMLKKSEQHETKTT